MNTARKSLPGVPIRGREGAGGSPPAGELLAGAAQPGDALGAAGAHHAGTAGSGVGKGPKALRSPEGRRSGAGWPEGQPCTAQESQRDAPQGIPRARA